MVRARSPSAGAAGDAARVRGDRRRRQISAALKKGRKVRARISATVTDPAGHTIEAEKAIRLLRPH